MTMDSVSSFRSQAALQGFIEEAKKQGLPEQTSSNHQKQARQKLQDRCHGGQLATASTINGNDITIHFANFLVYSCRLYNLGGSCTQLIQERHHSCPSSPMKPWSLVLYTDMRPSQATFWAELRGRHGHLMPPSKNSNDASAMITFCLPFVCADPMWLQPWMPVWPKSCP